MVNLRDIAGERRRRKKKELSFPHRTGQSHLTLYQNKHLERNSTVFPD